MEIYLQDDRYDALVTTLAKLQPCPVEGRITEDQVKLALGELANIWPAGIVAGRSEVIERSDSSALLISTAS